MSEKKLTLVFAFKRIEELEKRYSELYEKVSSLKTRDRYYKKCKELKTN